MLSNIYGRMQMPYIICTHKRNVRNIFVVVHEEIYKYILHTNSKRNSNKKVVEHKIPNPLIVVYCHI